MVTCFRGASKNDRVICYLGTLFHLNPNTCSGWSTGMFEKCFYEGEGEIFVVNPVDVTVFTKPRVLAAGVGMVGKLHTLDHFLLTIFTIEIIQYFSIHKPA